MGCVKYKGQKRGGMPVHFPIGCKSSSAITHRKTANPFLKLTDSEADKLVEIDPGNFAHATDKEVAEYEKDQASTGKLRGASGPLGCLSDEELEAEVAARRRFKAELKRLPKEKPEGEETEQAKPARAARAPKAGKGTKKPAKAPKKKPEPEPEEAEEQEAPAESDASDVLE